MIIRKSRSTLSISNEFHICHYGDGLKLTPPDGITPINHKPELIYYTIAEAFNLSLSVTILNKNCAIQHINEQSALTAGHLSIKHALGKSIRDTAKPESARFVIANNLEVMSSARKKICEEQVLLNDENSYHSIAVKSPLYNNKNEIIGLIGFGLVLGLNSVGESLNTMVKLGLLNAENNFTRSLPGKTVQHVYLSKRENEILSFLIKGYTARKLADRLNISRRTVEHHMKNIKIKMKVSSKAELLEKVTQDIL